MAVLSLGPGLRLRKWQARSRTSHSQNRRLVRARRLVPLGGIDITLRIGEPDLVTKLLKLDLLG